MPKKYIDYLFTEVSEQAVPGHFKQRKKIVLTYNLLLIMITRNNIFELQLILFSSLCCWRRIREK